MEKLLKIISQGSNCEGVAKTENGEVVFVDYALKDEVCNCEIVIGKNKFARAKILDIRQESKFRKKPLCPYYYLCGGCSCQHIDYNQALQIKTDNVKNNITKIAKLETSISPCVASKCEFNYRNKAVFCISKNAKLGLFKNKSHEIIEIANCCIIDEKLNRFISPINDILKQYKKEIYNWQTKTGIIKNIFIRVIDDEYSFLVVQTKKYNKFADELNKMLKTKNIKYSLYTSLNMNDNSLIYGDLYFVDGQKEVSYKPFSFVQVNTYIKNLIYKKVLKLVNGKNIVDAYSGCGKLSCMLCTKANNVYSVEIIKDACQDAEQLKLKENIKNLEIYNGDCAEVLPLIFKDKKIDVVVLDPPRKGCDEKVINSILKIKPKSIIYISCNSSTLARDLKSLKEIYNIEFIEPYDMFPQTKEVECLCSLIKK